MKEQATQGERLTAGAVSIPPPTRDEDAARDPGLYTRLTYLTAFRLAIVTALLGATTYVTLRPSEDLGGTLAALLYGLISFLYAASVGYLWVLRRKRRLGVLAWAQSAGDLLLATFLVYLTGGADSLFTLMYPLAIVNASILLGRRGALAAGAGGTVAFGLLTVALGSGVLQSAAPYLEQRAIPTAKLAFIVIANGSAFLLTAALATYLTDQVRRTGESLRERDVDYAALAELHGAIVRSMTAGIVTTDAHGRMTFMNPAAEGITGLSFTEIFDEPLGTFFPALAEGVGVALAKGLGRGEVDERVAGGELKRLQFVVNPLTRLTQRRRGRTRGMGEPGLTIVFEDLTALREMQEAVRRSDRLAAIGQLAAGLAHELRNPLASMSGAVELLARGPGLGRSEQRLTEIVLRETERLNALVTDFLAFARPRPVAKEGTDLALLADETMGVFRHAPVAADLALARTGDASLLLFADPAQMRQVLWNLLANAAEAMGGRGAVTVDVRWTATGHGRLQVTDTGPGISGADLPHLFEPFFTTKPQGTGLGLASVHQIVEAHGGRIEVQSVEGATTFTVLLPVGESVARPPPATLERAAG